MAGLGKIDPKSAVTGVSPVLNIFDRGLLWLSLWKKYLQPETSTHGVCVLREHFLYKVKSKYVYDRLI